MTVKEIFELRKQGRVEEAYELIRPMYKVHHGHYTTLCMFWCASDVLKLRIAEAAKRQDELRDNYAAAACGIFLSLQRLYPNLEDQDLAAANQLYRHAVELKKVYPPFSVLLFLSSFGMEKLHDADWLPVELSGVTYPSRASRLLKMAFRDFEAEPTYDNAFAILPIFQFARKKAPTEAQYAYYESACLGLL